MSVSGQAMPVGDLSPHWRQCFAEDFLTAVPLGRWPTSAYGPRFFTYKGGWKDTTKRGTYRPEEVLSVHDGVLDYYLHYANGEYKVATVCPLLHPPTRAGQLYGRHSIRFKTDSVPGYKWVPLLWPDSEVWPKDGESDFPEGNLDGNIRAYLHHQDATSPSDQDAYPTFVMMAGVWHTATTIWWPGNVEYYLDSHLVGHSTNRVPNTPMHLDLQAETATWGNAPTPTTAGHILVDWVVLYAYVP